MNRSHLLLCCLLCFFSGSGCSRVERNYSRNVQFYRDLRIDGQSQNFLNAARLQHLEGITPEELGDPVIFLAFVSNPPSEERIGTIDIHWSEGAFRQYLLIIRSGASEIAELEAIFTSEDSKSMGQKEDFDFVVHEASYLLSEQLFRRIRKDEAEGMQIELFLKNSASETKSKPLFWNQVRHSLGNEK